MEKTLTIGEQKVRLKSTAATPRRYKIQFQRDLFKDMMKLFPLSKVDLEKLDEEETMQAFLDLMDFDMFYDVMWSMAKTADKEIPEPLEWLDQFEDLRLDYIMQEVFPLIQDLLAKNMQTKNTKKK